MRQFVALYRFFSFIVSHCITDQIYFEYYDMCLSWPSFASCVLSAVGSGQRWMNGVMDGVMVWLMGPKEGVQGWMASRWGVEGGEWREM